MDLLGVDKINMDVYAICFGAYLVLLGIVYYFIFRKHHKRNHVELDELLELITDFYVKTIIATIALGLGLFLIILANEYKEDRMDVLKYVSSGIIVISIDILWYRKYLRNALADMNQVERDVKRVATIKIGEVVEFIFFIIFICTPLWRIGTFCSLMDNKPKMYLEIFKSFAAMVASFLLLWQINPLDVKHNFKDSVIK